MLFDRKKEKRLHSVVRRCNLILQMTRQKSRVNDNSSIRTLIFSGFKRNLEAPKQLGKTGAIFIISKEMSLKLFQRKCQLFKSRYIRSASDLSNKLATHLILFGKFFPTLRFLTYTIEKKAPTARFFTYMNEKKFPASRLFGPPPLLGRSK